MSGACGEPACAMLEALGAAGPHTDRAAALSLFGQFIGSWDVAMETLTPEGSWQPGTAEWHFGWILEGRAVMDVWISPPRGEPAQAAAPEYGATVRFYDAAVNRWRSVWIGPMIGVLRTFDVEQSPDQIVLRETGDPERPMRWIFAAITRDGYRWRSEILTAEGWTVVQRMDARRRGTG